MLLTALTLAVLQTHHSGVRVEGYLGVQWTCGPSYDSKTTFLTTDDGRLYKLAIADIVTHTLGALHNFAGERVALEAQEAAPGLLEVSHASLELHKARRPAPTTGPVTVSKPFITVLVTFSDTTVQPPHAPSWYAGLFNASGPSLPDYWIKQSYNAIDINGSVLMPQWIQLAHPKAYYVGDPRVPCDADPSKVLPDVYNALKPYYDMNSFYGANIMFAEPLGQLGWATGGRVWQTINGVSRLWNFTLNNDAPWLLHELAHEMGHALGFDHSPGPYSTNYDSDWDAMSGGTNHTTVAGEYGGIPVGNNAFHRYTNGWIPTSRVLYFLPGNTKVFRLEQLSNPTANGYLTAIIFKGAGSLFYTLETRKFSDVYDSTGGIPGECVVIHDVNAFRMITNQFTGLPYHDRESRVVDRTVDNNPNDAGAMFLPGQTFTDAANHITVQIIDQGPTYFDVQVTVGSTEPMPNVVSNTNDDGAGSLRGALYTANVFPSFSQSHHVKFAIPTSDPGYQNGVFNIKLQSDLVLSADGVTVNADEEKTFIGQGSKVGPIIHLDGTNAGQYGRGIAITGSHNLVHGFCVTNCAWDGIQIDGSAGATGNIVSGNYCGIDPTGTTAAANGIGGISAIKGATGNQIGGLTAADRNVVSGNTQMGIFLADPSTTGNVVYGNFIGTNSAGTAAVPNLQEGVLISRSASGNYIGNTNPGAGNLISGNTQVGMDIYDHSNANRVIGNLIGTNVTGTGSVQNGTGVYIGLGSSNNIIGSSLAAGANTISGNSYGLGISDPGTTGNQVFGNRIGTDVTGNAALPNITGVFIQNVARSNSIGVSNAGGGNIIAGNSGDGVYITDVNTSFNAVYNNSIGIAANGSPLGNQYGVVLANGANGNAIGNALPGQGNVIGGNIDGVDLISNARGNTVRGNWIGVTPSSVHVPNSGIGIALTSGATRNLIGGSVANANTIAYNGSFGALVRDATTIDNSVRFNKIYQNGNVPIYLYLSGDHSLAAPTLSNIYRTSSGVSITFNITGMANHTYLVDLYTSDTINGTMADLKTYVTTVTITTDGSGNGNKQQYFTLTAGNYLAGAMIDPTTADSGPCSGPSYCP